MSAKPIRKGFLEWTGIGKIVGEKRSASNKKTDWVIDD